MFHDVIIVGGGPNGLLMACELSLAGVRPLVLERLHERSAMPKANGLAGQVVQALDYRGLFQRFAGNHESPQPVTGFQFGALDVTNQPMYRLQCPQQRIEEILEGRSVELGVEIRRGHQVLAVSQDKEQVIVEATGPSGPYSLASRFLVAADGGRSTIRKQLGIGFPGITDDTFIGLTGQATILPPVAVLGTGDLDVPRFGRLKGPTFVRTETGVFGFGMFQPSVFRFVALEWNRPKVDDAVPVTVAEADETLSRVLGTSVEIAEPSGRQQLMLRRSSEGINSRQAERYREGRIFLVGDSAHVHAGIGGPGLNLGMQDALNLGWKLAAEIKGWAPKGLLDTYQTERYPVGERVIMHTRAQIALLSPGPNITALRKIFEELLRNPDNTRLIGEMMSGSDVRYSTSGEEGQTHRLASRFMPNLSLQIEGHTTKVAELMCNGRPVLLNLNEDEVPEAVYRWSDRVDIVQAVTHDDTVGAVLIRPDGYVAWACDGPVCATGLQTALESWFGAPGNGGLDRPGGRCDESPGRAQEVAGRFGLRS